jgi:predicted O-methyltransferase YrrM
VLEWGAGQSTLFWALRAKEVVAFESDRRWSNILMKAKPPNALIHLVKNDALNVESLLNGERFDVIVVDGLDRWKCAERSLDLLTPGGAIIVDDAERNSGPRRGYGCIERYREAGFSRMDFYGYSPGNTTQHCTSVFFRGECFLLRGVENPQVTLSFWEIA